MGLRCLISSHELCDENLTRMRATLSVKLDPLYLVKRFCREVSLTAIGAGDQWNVLDKEEVFALAEGFRDSANARTRISAAVTN
jgi:hypothetical protein